MVDNLESEMDLVTKDEQEMIWLALMLLVANLANTK